MRKAFICPTKYVQGEDELENLGFFVKTFGKSALLIAHPDDITRVYSKLEKTAKEFGVKFIQSNFNGQCSKKEISRLENVYKNNSCDCIIGLGGGKAIDTSKCVAKGDSLIICPTIAATDAPTSHSAVIYTEEGQFEEYAYFKQSPSVILIDTTVIANAPVRFLVSGMGDALSTYFETRSARASFSNVNAGLPCGATDGSCVPAKGTNASFALATLCYRTLLEDGQRAKVACVNQVVTRSLENIIEANILLSGLGFESGGLSAAHAIHDGLTILEETHAYMHGEKVAFGTLVQLVLENSPKEEINTVLDFCCELGLPVCLEDLGVIHITYKQLMDVAIKTCIPEESIHAMPSPITKEDVVAAIIVADKLGKSHKIGRA